MADDGGFLSRWSRRKEQAKQGGVAEVPAPVHPPRPAPLPARWPVSPLQVSDLPADGPEVGHAESSVAAVEHSTEPAPVAEPLPTMADVALLTRDSDYARFVKPGIDDGVKQAAMRKLFTDPHFNVMDGLDTYIDDYSQPDPIPVAMLRQMTQSWTLGLFDHEKDEAQTIGPPTASTTTPWGSDTTEPATEAAPEAATEAEPLTPSDDHADLRLQQDHAAGRPGPDQGPGA